jgi:hypothetical protein
MNLLKGIGKSLKSAVHDAVGGDVKDAKYVMRVGGCGCGLQCSVGVQCSAVQCVGGACVCVWADS